MPGLPASAWLIIAALIAAAVIGSLHAIASRLRRDFAVHDLTVETKRLRTAYQAHIERIKRGEANG